MQEITSVGRSRHRIENDHHHRSNQQRIRHVGPFVDLKNYRQTIARPSSCLHWKIGSWHQHRRPALNNPVQITQVKRG